MAKIRGAQANVYMIDGKIKACIMIGIDGIELGKEGSKIDVKYMDDNKKRALEEAMNEALNKWEFEYT